MTERLRAALQKAVELFEPEVGAEVHQKCATQGWQWLQEAKAALASQDMEQRAGFVMVPVEPTEQMLTAASVTRARRDEANLYRHEVAAIYGAMLAAAPPHRSAGQGRFWGAAMTEKLR